MFSRARSAAAAFVLLTGPAGAEVVLLHNGGVFEGAVQRTTDAVVIEGEGTYIRLRAPDVALVTESILAAYEWKRAQMAPGGLTAIDHLELADWAIENRLWEQAARELLDARQLVPQSQRLDLLERRLDEALRLLTSEPTPAKPTAGEALEAPTTAPVEGYNRPELPDGALEQFTRRIQPVLLNSCAASGCHGANPAAGFAFDVASLRGYGDLRSTERNLDQTLQLIDLQKPLDSKLLTIAKGPHAGVTPITGSRREEMLQRIAIWAGSIGYHNVPPVAAETPGVEQTAATAATQPTSTATVSMPPVARNTTTPAPVTTPPVAAATPTEPDWKAIVAAAEAKPPEIKHGVELQRVGPRDDFDPAVFNLRYRRPQDDQPME